MRQLLLLLFGVLLALPASALSPLEFTYTYMGQTLTYTIINYQDRTVEVKGGSATTGAGNPISGSLTIPAKVNDGWYEYSVINIPRYCFYECTGLTDIVIPNSVTQIENYAFYGCTSLSEIVISNSATAIGDYAFYGCTSLSEIVIPNSVTSIGDYAFEKCRQLENITFEDGGPRMLRLGEKAFYDTTVKKIYLGRDTYGSGFNN